MTDHPTHRSFSSKDVEENDYKILMQNMSAISSVDTTEWATVRSYFSTVLLDADKLYSNEFVNSRHVGILLDGMMKQVVTTENGRPYTVEIYVPGDLVGNYDNHIDVGTVKNEIYSLTACRLVSISAENLENVFDKSFALQRLGRKLMQHIFLRSERRVKQLLTLSSTERYEKFVEEFAAIEELIPDYEISAYLGITPVSLSRIKSKHRQRGD